MRTALVFQYTDVMTHDAMTDNVRELRRSQRRDYLRRRANARRAADREQGARRIDVTLAGEMLDDYTVVRDYLERLNRIAAARYNKGGPLFRLSAAEIIRVALQDSAARILDEEEKLWADCNR